MARHRELERDAHALDDNWQQHKKSTDSPAPRHASSLSRRTYISPWRFPENIPPGDPFATVYLVSYPPLHNGSLAATPFGVKVQLALAMANVPYAGVVGSPLDARPAFKGKVRRPNLSSRPVKGWPPACVTCIMHVAASWPHLHASSHTGANLHNAATAQHMHPCLNNKKRIYISK